MALQGLGLRICQCSSCFKHLNIWSSSLKIGSSTLCTFAQCCLTLSICLWQQQRLSPAFGPGLSDGWMQCWYHLSHLPAPPASPHPSCFSHSATRRELEVDLQDNLVTRRKAPRLLGGSSNGLLAQLGNRLEQPATSQSSWVSLLLPSPASNRGWSGNNCLPAFLPSCGDNRGASCGHASGPQPARHPMSSMENPHVTNLYGFMCPGYSPSLAHRPLSVAAPRTERQFDWPVSVPGRVGALAREVESKVH